MKTIGLLALSVLIGLLPFGVMAAEFRAGEDQLRITDEVINDNLYAGGGNVTVDSQVNGDVFIGGGQIDIEGNVSEDLFIGGGNVRIIGDVGGDVRIGAGNVRIEGAVGGELLVGSGTVEISEDASIAGDVVVGTGQLLIAGTTGAVLAEAGDVRIASTATINGDLKYSSPNEARIEEGAVITGETTYTLQQQPKGDAASGFAALAGMSVLWLITGLVMLLLFVYLLPAKAGMLATSWKDSFGWNLLTGFIFLVVTPVAAIVLLMSVIGIPLGLGALLLYPVVLYFGKLAGTIAFGVWIRSLLDKNTGTKVDWISALLGLIVLTIISFIPVLGAVVVAIVCLVGLGAVIRYDWGIIQGLRERSEL